MTCDVVSVSSGVVVEGGPFFRKQTLGPELDLVNNYIKNWVCRAPKGQSISIFYEPKLDSGFPDAVVVYWYKNVTETWKESRKDIKKSDMRLLHYLSTYGSRTDDELVDFFEFDVLESLDRLYTADMILKNKKKWRACSLKKNFSVKRIIAIEAKLNGWRKGLQQATHNIWFASESYLLIPNIPKGSELIDKASQLGVGVVTNKTPINDSIVAARKEKIPSSYASWLFNEWVWKTDFYDLKKG